MNKMAQMKYNNKYIYLLNNFFVINFKYNNTEKKKYAYR